MTNDRSRINPSLRCLALLALFLGLTACSEAPQEQKQVSPVPFQDGEECHVCGMIISEFAGPKGQAIDAKTGTVSKFCSTRDMLSWWLQPENQHLNASLYVHDMARSDWQHPDDRHLIDAKSAFYVLGSGLQGAMGPTLASFGDREAAEKLAAERGGRVLAFGEISLDILQQMMSQPHGTLHHN